MSDERASLSAPEAPSGALRQAWRALPRAALGNLMAKLLIVALGLAITVLVARQGPSVQGAFALFVAVESALLTLFSGLGLWLARLVSRQQAGERGATQPMLRKVLQAAVALGLLASLALVGVAWGASSVPYTHLWLLALAAPFLLLVPTATGLWLGQGRMWPLNLAQVGAPAAVLSGLAVVWWLTQDLAWKAPAVVLVLTAWVSGKSLVAVLTALYALHDGARRDEDREEQGLLHGAPELHWWSDWRFVATIGVTNVVSLLNYRASLFLVEHFHGLAEVGTYSVAVTVAELLWLLSSSVTVSAYSRIGHPDRAVASGMTVQAVRINVLATLLAAPVLLGLAWWGLPRLMGAAYAASVMPLAALLPGVAAYAAASSLSAFYTNHLGKPQLSGSIAALSLVISFSVGCVLVPLWGAVGAATASSLGYILAIVAAYGVFLKHAGLPLRALWTPAR
ncbi:MAG TPA: teichoic acid transporter [Aquabacterium sp.]|uniref:lipopolysaccharide biosynthesis protein n=1 Tax=Aquabacterium sp. TaxID=1872578 RepID=UPI002E368BD2|nr:teichoic acid transporter [Aquabacterium sp.]HEX5371238.1 teichoic acid transporter [Aquabacterium sp.]